ncbi:MAG: NAD(P)-dependent alcohol dehydrogenase, partial [Chloroflexota bacterium]
ALSRMPDGITFEAATAVPFGATTALVFLRDKGRIQKGQRVLIYGASGSVGSAAVQLAKSFGAQVTAVCSTEKVDRVKSVGADDVIDYKKGDFTKEATLKYDLIFDAVGKTSFAQCRSILAKDGTYITLALSLPIIFQTVWTTLFGKQRVIGTVVSGSAQDMQLLKTHIEAGKFNPVVDRAYPMTQIAEAHRYVDNGRKWGNVVVTF